MVERDRLFCTLVREIYFLWSIMKISVVIPTRGDQNMENILTCLQAQTFKDFEVIFVVDKILELGIGNQESGNITYITNLNSSLCPNNNASILRNYWIKAAKGDYILLMDDDEQFDTDYFEKNLSLRTSYREKIGKDFVLTPTLMYRKTWGIQNQWFSYFNYFLSRPIPMHLKKERDYIQMYSGNSLFAPAYIFQQILFDEQLDFVYEDLDFTYRIHRAGYPIIVLRDLKIYHMERDKTLLEHARVGNEYAAYRKAKHRVMFVKKYAHRWEKILFYSLGFWWHPLRLIAKILWHDNWHHAGPSIRALVRGTFGK